MLPLSSEVEYAKVARPINECAGVHQEESFVPLSPTIESSLQLIVTCLNFSFHLHSLNKDLVQRVDQKQSHGACEPAREADSRKILLRIQGLSAARHEASLKIIKASEVDGLYWAVALESIEVANPEVKEAMGLVVIFYYFKST